MANVTLTLSQALRSAVSAYDAGEFIEAEQICQQIINAKHDLFDALHLLAVVQSRLGKKDAALASYERTLEVRPDYAEAHLNRGNIQHELRRFEEALASYDCALQVRSDYAEALSNRGNTLKELKLFDEALVSYDRALQVRPDYAEAHLNRGNVLHELRRFGEVLASYDRALKARPDYAKAHFNRGNILNELRRFEEALASYDRALSVRPDYAKAHFNRGNVLHRLRRFDEALASYDRTVKMRPNYAEAHFNRGNTLKELKRFAEALRSYDHALIVRPDYAEALSNRGITLHQLRRFAEALASYDRALKVRPNYAEALSNRGNTLKELKLFEAALGSYDQAITLQPDYAIAFHNRGVAFQELDRIDEALASYDKAIGLNPDHLHAFSGAAYCALKLCDSMRTAKLAGEIQAHVVERKSIVSPFVLLGYSSDAALQLKCARTYMEEMISTPLRLLRNRERYSHERIRIAYLSADFRRHPMAFLLAELFEVHDRSRFQVLGFSYGPDDQSDVRARLVAAFDRFHVVHSMGDRDVAELMNDAEVDIAIDLNGLTRYCRPGILAHRPAPIQVNYLGYPGTMGADFIDYVIADKVVLPLDQQPFWTERIVHLPDCYQVNDSKRKIAAHTPTRKDAGLPDQGFVFCSFNNTWKITPAVFDVWMGLLKAVDHSVLWLLRDNPVAERNLRKEAALRGVDPQRLVFAENLVLEDHLARQRLADLFLDTLPYNAHTTASDALWAGLPLLTCCGESFASRVAASLLNAVGLGELVTHSLEEYEALALKLVREGPLLAGIKAKLARHRDTYPLFNTERFTRHLERAYTTMREIWQRGESPRGFSVAPEPDSGNEMAHR